MPCRPDCGACCENIWAPGPERMEKYLTPEAKYDPKLAVNVCNSEFMRDNWVVEEVRGDEARYSCGMFDFATRRCLAGNKRPPICVGYPWYNQTPSLRAGAAKSMSNLCGYMEDIRTVLPLVAINGVDQI